MKKKGIEAFISSGGVALEEYNVVEGPGDNAVVKGYVASQAGKPFELKWCSDSAQNMSCKVLFDGNVIKRRNVRQREWGGMDRCRVDKSTVQLLEFSTLRLTDDETAPMGGPSLEKLGTIELQFRRCNKVGETRRLNSVNSSIGCSQVHEKTKKAGAHTIIFGKRIHSVATEKDLIRDRIEYLDKGPYATFIWHYRPKEHLQAQGIMPLEEARAATHRPGSIDADERPAKRARRETSAKDAENGNMPGSCPSVKQEFAMSELEKLKTERALLDARIHEVENDAIKREASPIRLISKPIPGEIIDLTDD